MYCSGIFYEKDRFCREDIFNMIEILEKSFDVSLYNMGFGGKGHILKFSLVKDNIPGVIEIDFYIRDVQVFYHFDKVEGVKLCQDICKKLGEIINGEH